MRRRSKSSAARRVYSLACTLLLRSCPQLAAAAVQHDMMQGSLVASDPQTGHPLHGEQEVSDACLPSRNTCVPLPVPGLGTANAAAVDILSALRLGYRHVDTAQRYGNERDVGRALAESGLRREAVFITTKIWTANWGYNACRASLRQSLSDLGTSYANLVLLHAPGDPATRADTWRALEDALREGQARAIGVSNFGVAHLQKLEQTAVVKPAVNQIEVHPWLQRRELVEYCRQQGIAVMAYSPLAKAQKLSDPTIAGIAQRMGVTPAQVLIRWSMQKGFVPLPKSSHPERQQTNLDVFSFEMTGDDMSALDGLEEGLVTNWDPAATHEV